MRSQARFLRLATADIWRRLWASDLFGKILGTFGVRLLQVALGLVTSVMVARVLGPEGRGLYAVAIAIGATGVQLGNLGLHSANTFWAARDREYVAPLLANSLWVGLGAGSLGALLAGLGFTLLPAFAPLDGLLLALALGWVPLGLGYLLLQSLILGVQDVKGYNLVEIGTKFVGFAGLVALLAAGGLSPETALATTLVSSGVGFLWLLWLLRDHLKLPPRLSVALLKENLPYGLKAYLAALLAFTVLRVDLFLVQAKLGSEDAGFYSIAVTLAEMVYMLPVVVGTMLFPKLSAMPDEAAKWNLTRKTAALLGLLMAAVGGVTVILAEPVVRLLYGASFLPAVPALGWLMPGIVLLSINVVLMNYFASQAMPWVTVISPFIAALLNIGLNLALIPAMGIRGAALASTLSYASMLLCSLVYLGLARKKVA